MKEEDNQYIKLIKAEAKKLKASDKNEQDIITIWTLTKKQSVMNL